MSDFDAIHGSIPSKEPAAPAPQDVNVPAEPGAEPIQPSFDEAKYLSEVTGGLISSREEIPAFIERAKAADEVVTLREQLQTAYPNEFTKSLSEMVRAGASPDQLKSFIDLGLVEDISAIDDTEALIKAAYLKESDILSAEDARLLIEGKYPKSAEDLAIEKGLSDEEAERQFKRLEIERKREVKQAKEFLQGFKKDVYENVVTGGSKAKIENAQKAWQPTLPAIGKQLLSEAISLKVADEKAGIDFNFEIKLPKEFVDNVVASIPSWAANAGLEVNGESVATIVEESKKAYIASNYKNILETVARDAYSNALKKITEEYSNPNKPGTPQGTLKPVAEKEFVDSFYR
jgi:hypothetical protein